MNTTPQDLLAQAILLKEKRKAHAKAVLNRPASIGLPTLVVGLVGGLASYLASAEKFEAPLSVKMLLASVLAIVVVNTMELWTTRRRLDAAITLLQLQQESSDSNASQP